MIIPKFIYKEMLEIKQKQAYKKGYNDALDNLATHLKTCYGAHRVLNTEDMLSIIKERCKK